MHIIIVGAGLAGLTAATTAARAGAQVTVLDGAGQVGGRARSRRHDGFTFNLGPHALYLGGGGADVLDDLGVARDGAPPVLGRALADLDDGLAMLPITPPQVLGSRLLSPRGKLQVAAAFLRWGRERCADDAAEKSWGEWMDRHTPDPTARRLVAALGRLASYTAGEDVSAQIPLQQLRLAGDGGVHYLHGGWQRLVDGLRGAAEAAGAVVHEGRAVRHLATTTGPSGDHQVWTVGTDDGGVTGDAVVVATPPAAAAALLDGVAPAAVVDRIREVRPITASVLDIALRRLPVAGHTFALGLHARTYLSVHSAAARLAPDGGAMVHLVRYLEADDEVTTSRAQLEALMDRAQPGWRDHVIRARFLPHLTVAGDAPGADRGGLRGRVGVQVTSGLALAGDWVGDRGWLGDAALLSGRTAARRLIEASPTPAGASHAVLRASHS